MKESNFRHPLWPGARAPQRNRVKAALDEGLTVREVAAKLSLPQEAVEPLRQLVDWRFSEETRYTLTDKALAMLAYRGKGNVA